MSEPRLLIAGTNSGCGKTTVALALIAIYKNYFPDIVAYKCGFDYIDAGFQRSVEKVDTYNLDSWYLGSNQLQYHFLKTCSPSISIIEGISGLFDGIGTAGEGSTFQISEKIKSPVILVINCRGISASIRAIIRGFKQMSGDKIKGVILNKVSVSYYPYLKSFCEMEGVLCFGFIPFDERLKLGSWNTDLMTIKESADLPENIELLISYAKKYVDLKSVFSVACAAEDLNEPAYSPIEIENNQSLRLAVASDEAFCFTYQENMEMFQENNIEIVPFSPVHDMVLPPDISGLYLPGGYQELHLKELSENNNMKRRIKGAILEGMPTFAECGGFLYLHEFLEGYPMVDIIHGSAEKHETLQRFGYGTLVSNNDNLLLKKGEEIPIHEFHYYSSSFDGSDCYYIRKRDGKKYPAEHAKDNLFAGFPYLYFPAKPEMVQRFKKAMIQYKERQSDE